MEIDAIINTIGDEQAFGTNGFRKRNLVAIIGYEDRYPQTVQFEVHGDKCPLLDEHYEGQKVRLHFDIRGREWRDKIFNSLVIWRIAADEADKPQKQPQEPTRSPEHVKTPDYQESYPASNADSPLPPINDDDDIPF